MNQNKLQLQSINKNKDSRDRSINQNIITLAGLKAQEESLKKELHQDFNSELSSQDEQQVYFLKSVSHPTLSPKCINNQLNMALHNTSLL